MGILSTIDSRRPVVQNATFQDPQGWLADWLRGGEASESGISVNERSAMRISTVMKCVYWRANQIGMLPWHVYERVQILGRDAKRKAAKHPAYDLIHSSPNPTLTAKAFFSMVSADLHLWGNSYAYIERGANSGRLRGLWRLLPDTVTPKVDKETKRIKYHVRDHEGRETVFLSEEIWHVRGLGYDGVMGYSPIRLVMQTLGWNAAAVKYGARFFKNASRPSGLVILPNGIKPEAKKSLIENLRKSGDETGKLAIIEGAAEYKSITMPQNEAQFIETMQYQEEDICGIMGVPQHKVGILRRSTNNNIEHQGIEAVTDCLQPVCADIEQSLSLTLLSGSPSSGVGGGTERSRYVIQCNLKGLLRGDTAAQTQHIKTMIDAGVYSQNDGCTALDVEPFEGGDDHWINGAYVPLDLARKMAEAEDEPEPTPAAKEVQARFYRAFGRIWRDAAAHVCAKDGKHRAGRAQFALGRFRAPIEGLAEGLGVSLDAAFVDDYLGALSKRADSWVDPDEAAKSELERAVTAILGRK